MPNPNLSPLSQQINEMQAANGLALQIIKKAQQEVSFKTDNLYAKCSVCYGSGWQIVYQNGIRGAKRCPNAVWDENKKQHICHLNAVVSGQVAHRKTKQELLNTVRSIAFKLQIDANMFLGAMKQFFKVNTLEDLMIQQLDLILMKLKLAEQFKIDLVQKGLIQQKCSLPKMSQVA